MFIEISLTKRKQQQQRQRQRQEEDVQASCFNKTFVLLSLLCAGTGTQQQDARMRSIVFILPQPPPLSYVHSVSNIYGTFRRVCLQHRVRGMCMRLSLIWSVRNDSTSQTLASCIRHFEVHSRCFFDISISQCILVCERARQQNSVNEKTAYTHTFVFKIFVEIQKKY